MKLNTEENLLVVSNKKRDLNEVLDKLVDKDSKKVAAFLVEKTSLPRELRIGALRLVLNDYVKMAKELVLSDEFMYRLNWYEKFSEYQLVNFWNILESNNSDKFDAETEAIRFKKTFYLLLLMNADAVEFSDKELEALLKLNTPESTVESFKEFMNESDGAFYDYECNFDGMSYEDFKTVLKKCSTVADIRNIASKYGINVPKRLKKEELVALVLEGLRRQGKATDETEAELKKMSAITLQRYAKVNGVKASTEMKKDDIIEFIMNRIESSPKAVRKPRIQLATLPELEEFEFSKDYLREVSYVDEDDDQEEVAPAAPVVEEPVVEEPVVEPLAVEVVEEPAVEENSNAAANEELLEKIKAEEERYNQMVESYESRLTQLEEMIVAMNSQPAPAEEVVEEVEAETEIVEEEAEAPVNTPYNDELLVAITQLLLEREKREESRSGINEEFFNKMVESYEKRLAQLEEMLISMHSQPAQQPVQPAPITIHVNYPGENTKVVEVVKSDEPDTVVEEPVAEEAPVVEESELAPVVVDPTFDTLTPKQTADVVGETMDGLTVKKGQVVEVPKKLTREEKRELKRQRKADKRKAKAERKEAKRIEREELRESKRLLNELAKNEKKLAKDEKKLAKQEKKLAKKKRTEEAAAVKAEKEQIKEERILNQQRLAAEKDLAAERRREAKRKAKAERKAAKKAKKEAKKQKKLEKKARKEQKILDAEMKKAEAEAARNEKKPKLSRKQKKQEKKAKKEQKVLESEMAKASEEAMRLEKKKAKIERIRVKNDIAMYNSAKRRAFWGFIKAIILIALLVVVAALTITTLIDLKIIVGPFADFVNNFTTQYIPFMSPTGVVRVNVTIWVQKAIEFINKF